MLKLLIGISVIVGTVLTIYGLGKFITKIFKFDNADSADIFGIGILSIFVAALFFMILYSCYILGDFLIG